MVNDDVKKLTDEELVVRINDNDLYAQDELFKRYKYVVLSIARKYFLIGGDPEDLVQEGMVAVFKAISTYSGKSSFSNYASACVKNRIISVIKDSNRNKNKPLNNYISLSGTVDGDLDKSVIITDTKFGPEESYINDERAKEIALAIKVALSDFEFDILNLYLKGYSYKEISEKKNKNEKSIDNAIQRIRKKILAVIKDSD